MDIKATQEELTNLEAKIKSLKKMYKDMVKLTYKNKDNEEDMLYYSDFSKLVKKELKKTNHKFEKLMGEFEVYMTSLYVPGQGDC